MQTGKTALQMASRGSFIGIVDMIIKAERCQRLLEAEGVGTMQCGEVHHCFYGATCNALAGRPSSVSKTSNLPLLLIILIITLISRKNIHYIEINQPIYQCHSVKSFSFLIKGLHPFCFLKKWSDHERFGESFELIKSIQIRDGQDVSSV